MEYLTGARKPAGSVLVIHSWWGLTPSFREYGGLLADAGFAVGLSDLFDGRTAADEAGAKKLRRMPRRVPMYRTLMADLQELSARIRSRHRAIVGFSMGGHWAVWLSQRPELRIDRTVLYYAARAGDFSSSRSAYLAHFADNDEWVNPAARRRMATAIRAAGRTYKEHEYPGTRHWFAESARVTEYDRMAAEIALGRTLEFLACSRSAVSGT